MVVVPAPSGTTMSAKSPAGASMLTPSTAWRGLDVAAPVWVRIAGMEVVVRSESGVAARDTGLRRRESIGAVRSRGCPSS